jgi:hypothetical protein
LAVSVTVGLILILQLDWLTYDRAAIDPDEGPLAALAGIESFDDEAVPHLPLWDRVPTQRRDTDLDEPGMAPHLGAVGLALGASCAAWTEWFLLRRRLRRRFAMSFTSGWGRQIVVAGVVAAATMAALAALLDRAGVPGPVDAAIVGTIGLALYAACLWLQGLRPGPAETQAAETSSIGP